jgi:hypothetical protein
MATSQETITMSVAETVLNKTFKSGVTDPLSITLFQENVTEEPPNPSDTAEYIDLVVNYGAADRTAKATNIRDGIMTAQIYTPLGTGTGRAIVIAEQIIDAFSTAQWAKNVMSVTDIVVLKIGKTGSFYQTNVDVSFQYYETQN